MVPGGHAPEKMMKERLDTNLSERDKHAEVASGRADGVITGVDLYWIPLGAGGAGFVRLNGRIYEAVRARLERRRPFDLYHAALEVHTPEARFVVEMTPIPDNDRDSRGVVLEGPVGSRWLSWLRVFRYEIRRWRSGLIPDADEALASPYRLSHDSEHALRLLDLVDMVPALVWGRDQLGVRDMWSSNSVISWLLVRSGLPVEGIRPPTGGRAPGWRAGIVLADHHQVYTSGLQVPPGRTEPSSVGSRGRIERKHIDETPTVARWLP